MEYLARWRMLLAAERPKKNSSDDLSAIAQSLGYEFESAFREGVPPHQQIFRTNDH
jgi:hypothetical protein